MYISITTKEFSEKTKISLQMSRILLDRFRFDCVKDGRTLRYKLTKEIVGQMIEFAKNLSEHSTKWLAWQDIYNKLILLNSSFK